MILYRQLSGTNNTKEEKEMNNNQIQTKLNDLYNDIQVVLRINERNHDNALDEIFFLMSEFDKIKGGNEETRKLMDKVSKALNRCYAYLRGALDVNEIYV